MDSWSARKLEPGLAQQYSMPSDLMTSTMKSDPGRSLVRTSTGAGGAVSAARAASDGAVTERRASACCAIAAGGLAARTAAPAAAPFKKPRLPTESILDFAMGISYF